MPPAYELLAESFDPESFDTVDEPVEDVDDELEEELVSDVVLDLPSPPAGDFVLDSLDSAFFRASDG